jgi:hypothetical protein
VVLDELEAVVVSEAFVVVVTPLADCRVPLVAGPPQLASKSRRNPVMKFWCVAFIVTPWLARAHLPSPCIRRRRAKPATRGVKFIYI